MNGCAEKRSVLPNSSEISIPRKGEFVRFVKSTISEVNVAKILLMMRTFGTDTFCGRFWIVLTGCQI